MVEYSYSFTTTNQKTIEKVIEDDHAVVNHMVLPKNNSLPEHYSNSNVYMIVARGSVSLQLND